MAQQWNSRQAMLEDRFEIFHYQDRKVDVELHHHDFYEIYYFFSGNVSYSIEGQSYQLIPGDVLLMAPEELHQPLVQPGQSYERYVLWVDRQYLAQLSQPAVELAACFQPENPRRRRVLRVDWSESAQLRLVMQQLLLTAGETDAYARMEQQALLTQLLARLNRLCEAAPVVEPNAQLTAMMTQVVHYIDAHLTEPVTLEELAAHFYLSKYHLLREFQKCFGTTIHKYIQKRRLMQAKMLLNQDMKPSALYMQCGFRDYTTFYRAFVGEYGLSPREYQAFVQRRR